MSTAYDNWLFEQLEPQLVDRRRHRKTSPEKRVARFLNDDELSETKEQIRRRRIEDKIIDQHIKSKHGTD